MKFKIKLLDVQLVSEYYLVFHVTTGPFLMRIPSLVIFKNGTIEIDNDENAEFANPLRFTNLIFEVNRTYSFELHQMYQGGGNYRYYILIDGKEVHSVLNPDAKQYYDLKVYMSLNTNNPSAPVEVSNFEHTNFL